MKRFAYLTALAASLVLAAGTGAAIGSTRPDDRATHGPSAVALEQRTNPIRPDDRAMHGPSAIALEQHSDAVRPDDRATRGPGAIVFEQVTRAGKVPVIAPAGSSAVRVDRFDWLDAGIGAAAALGLGLIFAGGVIVLRRGHAPAYS